MNWKSRTRTFLGYSWAVLCILVVPATFVGMSSFARALARGTGLQITPWNSGGEVRRTFEHRDYSTRLHRPVFDGLLSERAEGFVQIDWVPAEGGTLPQAIEESLDVNGDGIPDLSVKLDTRSGAFTLIPAAPWVLGADHVIAAGGERILRVRLRNPAASR